MLLSIYSLLLLTLFGPKTQVLSIPETQRVLTTSVRIVIKMFQTDEDGNVRFTRGGCSGTYVTASHVLTAAHCFSLPNTNIWVKDYEGVTHTGVLLKIDPEHDLALVAVQAKHPHRRVRLARSIRVGEKVIVVGSPLGLSFLVSEGIVSLLHAHYPGFKSLYLIHTAMINPGSSGGGAFNENGELIGVNTMSLGGMFGWAGISMAVSVEDIRSFLK